MFLEGGKKFVGLEKLESPMNLICVTPTEIQALFSDFKKEGLQQPSDPDPWRLIAVRTLTPGPKRIPSVQTRSQRFGHTHGGDVFSTANYCCSTLFFSSFRAAHKL